MKKRFESIDILELETFVSTAQEENLILEFKTINDAQLTNKDDRKNFAKALSGFANSSGGLIIWGIEAKKNKEGIDCARSLKPIDNPSLLLSRLNELTGTATSPIIDGVEHKVIHAKEKDKKGYAVSYIPEGDLGPYMAKLGEDRYYKRSGDSFYRMEHFDLEDMFGRRPKPILDIHTIVTGKGQPSVRVRVGIINSGRGSAKAPYIAFKPSDPFRLFEYGLDGNRNEGLRRLPFSKDEFPYVYGEGLNTVIHPGIVHEVAVINLGHPTPNVLHLEDDLIIEYEIAAENVRAEKRKKVIPLSELKNT